MVERADVSEQLRGAARSGLKAARRRAGRAGQRAAGLRESLGGYRHLRIGTANTAPVPEGLGEVVNLTADGVDVVAEAERGLDWVTVSPGGLRRIEPWTLQALIACEQAGVPTVLVAAEPRQLETPAAAVTTHIATPNEDVHRELLSRVGPQRAFLIRAEDSPRAQARGLLKLLRAR